MPSKPCCYLSFGILGSILTLGCLAFGIFSLVGLEPIIKKKAAEGALLLPETYQQWGQVPGSLDVNLTRRYTFFNFTNAFEVFFFNETPKFVQTTSHLYREYQNLSDPKYTYPDLDGRGMVVDFNYQLYNLPVDASPDDLVTTINLGALGFWYSAQRLPDHQIANYAINSLIRSLEEDIPTTLQAAAIQVECLNRGDKSQALNIFSAAGIDDDDHQDLIWSDPVHGLGQRPSTALWVHAIAGGPGSGAGKILGDYFYLTSQQLNSLLGSNSQLHSCVNGINSTVTNGYACPTNPDGDYCAPYFLVTTQWSSQNITKNPAGGVIDSKPSVTFFNTTVAGYLELEYFLTEYFITAYNVDPAEYDIIFSLELTKQLLNYTASEGSQYCTDEDTLMHVGNQQFIWEIGQQFDADTLLHNNQTNLTILQPIADRFNLPSLQHAHVLWKYIQYFQSEFILKESWSGNKGHLIFGQFVSESLYQSYIFAVDNVLQDLTSRVMIKNMTSNNVGCVELFENSIGLDEDSATTLCQNDLLSSFNQTVIEFIVLVCSRISGEEYNQFRAATGLTQPQMTLLCQSNAENSFFGIMAGSELYIKNHYACSPSYANAPRCSSSELIVNQWASSAITLNVPDLLKDDLPVSDSLKDWYPQAFNKPFEYAAVLKLLNKNFPTPPNPIDFKTASQLLTFDKFFSQTMCQNAAIFFEQQMWTEFSDTFFGVDPYPVVLYFRYLMMEVGMGGFAQTRTVGELLWGYTDPILSMIKEADPLVSGDPSLNPIVNLAGENCSYAEAAAFPVSMYTGVNDSALTRNVRSYFGADTITFPASYYNGNESVPVYLNPWKEEIAIKGSDGNVNNPGLKSSQNVNLFVMDLGFQTNLTYTGKDVDYSGVNSFRYTMAKETFLNKTNYPDNTKWFADKWDGLINISASHSAPLFVSKGRFLDTDPLLYDAVLMYEDKDMTKRVKSSAADDFFIDIEPYSGVAVGVQAAFQVNYGLKSDGILMINENEAMLPIVITDRGFGLGAGQIDQVYGQLKDGLYVQRVGPIIGFVTAFVLLLSVLLCFRRRSVLLKQFSEEKEHDNDSYHALEQTKNGNSYGIDKETLAITRMKTKDTRDKTVLHKALGITDEEEA